MKTNKLTKMLVVAAAMCCNQVCSGEYFTLRPDESEFLLNVLCVQEVRNVDHIMTFGMILKPFDTPTYLKYCTALKALMIYNNHRTIMHDIEWGDVASID